MNGRLLLLRKTLKLSQEEFGKIIDKRQNDISRYEKAKLEISTEELRKLAINAKVNLNWLIIGDGEMFIKQNTSINQAVNGNHNVNVVGNNSTITKNFSTVENNAEIMRDFERLPDNKKRKIHHLIKAELEEL